MDRLASPLAVLFASLSARSAAPTVPRPEWRRHFDAHGVQGSFLLFEPERERYLALDEPRARHRLLPAGTFEVALALVGLESGAIADEREVFRWDGKPRLKPAWERDQTLATAMRDGTVWAFQQVARRVGRADLREWLQRLEYGNASVAGGVDHFWLQGGLRIGAYEQLRLLHRLSEGRLPATQRAQRLVRDSLVAEKTRGHTLFAKSGTSGHARDAVAWWIGWIEKKGRPAAYFALTYTPTPATRLDARYAVGRAILQEAGALP